MAILLIVDIMVVISSMHVELYFLESMISDFMIACSEQKESLHGYGDRKLLEVEEQLKYTSISILCFFALDIILSLVGEGVHYLRNPLHCLDTIIVGLSLFFELQDESYASVLLIVGRLWRFFRLIHGTVEIAEEEVAISIRKDEEFKADEDE